MELDGLTFPLTRGQLDTWLAQQTSCAGTECRLRLFAKVEGRAHADLREHAHRHALQEDEQLGAAFLEVDSHGLQKTVGYLDVELAACGLSRFQYPAWEACKIALSALRARMLVGGPLFKFVSLQTRVNEFFCLMSEHAHTDSGGNRVALPQSANAIRRPLSGRI
jgi:hypothetical protein